MNITIVTVVTKNYLHKLKWTLPTWQIKEELKNVPLIMFYWGIDESKLLWVKDYYPNTSFINWNYPQLSNRESAFNAFVFGSCKYVKTPYFVKIDADAFAINNKPIFEEDDFNYDLVGHKWSYTKPGHWIDVLDNYYNNTNNKIEKTRICRHKRIASYICLHKTKFVEKISTKLNGKLPVPSHDTTLWYFADKEGTWKPKNFKRKGFTNNSRWHKIREEICSYESANNPFLNKELLSHVQIEVTTDCQLGCNNCDRACGIAKSNEKMTKEQILKFVNESLKLKHKWKRIDIIGGEPTLHPDLLTIIDYIKKYKNENPDCIIRLSTNGLGKKVNDILKILPNWIRIRNSSKTSKEQPFSPYNFAPIDLGIRRARSCSVPWRCGIALTRYGYFLCGAGASVCRVFNKDIGIKKLRRVNIRRLLKQRKFLCSLCGHSRSVNRKLVTKQVISSSWEEAILKYKENNMELY